MASSLQSLFEYVVKLVRETPPTSDMILTNEDKLRLYGLYKHVTVGNCSSSDIVPPSKWNLIARAKYDAWNSYCNIDRDEAMIRYIRVVANQNHSLGHQCRELLQAYEQDQRTLTNPASELDSSTNRTTDKSEGSNQDGDNLLGDREMICSNTSIPEKQKLSYSKENRQLPLWQRILGIQPLLPRGQLDISYTELAFAAFQCLEFQTAPKRDVYEAKISASIFRDNPNHDTILLGLSVRTLLDLYLRAVNYPPGSEIIMSPPINIPSMVTILEYHDLKIVPVDLPESFVNDHVLRIDINEVEKSITSKTVAVMIVHPFGIETTTHKDMELLRTLADKHDFDILEDCAECYAGNFKTTNPPLADLTLYSFGTIKTATSLGGGIALLRNKSLSTKMKRIYKSLYELQSQTTFLIRVLTAFIIQIFAHSPTLYSLLHLFCRFFGLNFDSVVSSPTKNFSSLSPNNLASFLKKIRRAPSLALLKTLHMKLEKHTDVVLTLNTKLKRCENLMAFLQSNLCLKWPKPPGTHTWWLAPIMVSSPEETSKRLLRLGYDVPRGLSQLTCIGVAPRAQSLMDSILYLPVASRNMSLFEIRSLAEALKVATNTAEALENNRSSQLSQNHHSMMIYLLFCIIIIYGTGNIGFVVISLTAVAKIFFLFFLLRGVFSVILTRLVADVYLESSACFAKYNSLLPQVFEPKLSKFDDEKRSLLDEVPGLRLSCPENSRNKHCIILTGATGFLGSNILYQLLSKSDFYQAIDKVIVIVRSKKGETASYRMESFLKGFMFSFLSPKERAERILVFEGDISKPNASLSPENLSFLTNDVKILSVINCAASVRFDQSLDTAAISNIQSALELQLLSQRLNANFVHISTAFVHGGLTGTKSFPLSEKLFDLGSFDVEKIYGSMTGNQMYASLAMSTLGFHNTYTFSKCICEHLLLRQNPNNTVIIRPSIIGPAIHSPFEGWSGQRPSTIVAAACLYMKFPFSIWSFGRHEAPVIPVDVVSRLVLKIAMGEFLISFPIQVDRSETSSPDTTEYEKVSISQETESESLESDEETSKSPNLGESNSPILNAAWSSKSSGNATFSWYSFATSVPHFGTALGTSSRLTAYISFAISVNILPTLGLSTQHFSSLYYLLVKMPYFGCLHILRFFGFQKLHENLLALSSVLDLPMLFYPFANSSFYFDSRLQAPTCFNGERYMFFCVASAHRFLHTLATTPLERLDTTCILIGGKDHTTMTSDIWWALTQPRGNILMRFLGFFFLKIFRSSCDSVTLDASSFSKVVRYLCDHEDKEIHVILAPTHRSFYDFILLSFIAFSLPELRIQIPFIAAAEEFSSLPYIGWILHYLNAFYVRRGTGKDPNLEQEVRRVKNKAKGQRSFIEVFIEGTRSRDRRYQMPKTGFLRCLIQTGGKHLIIPINISYERIPEQDALVNESKKGLRGGLTTKGLSRWIWETLQGNLFIGKIHISAAESIFIEDCNEMDFKTLALSIQRRQQELTVISDYHLKAASLLLSLEPEAIREALLVLGCRFWRKPLDIAHTIRIPKITPREAWSVTMQFGHVIAPYLKESHKFWASWLCPCQVSNTAMVCDSDSVIKLIEAFETLFDAAQRAVDEATERLSACPRISRGHVLEGVKQQMNGAIPEEILVAYCTHILDFVELPEEGVVETTTSDDVGNDYEALGMWGYRDSRFQIRPDANGKPSVVLSGSRYRISGTPLKKLIPFIEKETNTVIDIFQNPIGVRGFQINETELSEKDIEIIQSVISRISLEPNIRIRHGTGHSQEEIYFLRKGRCFRVPDIVLWPSSEMEIVELIQKALEHSWNLIPYGGGTNVSQATKCPSKLADPRPIISVDMTGLNRILSINEEDGIAHVQAGITGQELITALERRGYTMGHEPDSFEFSTLGGWIATKASGMKRAKYGNIEDIVVDICVAGSSGLLWQGKDVHQKMIYGRQSRGPNMMSIFFGSEGCLGIITSAFVRICPLPQHREYDSILLPDFSTGLRLVYNVSRLGSQVPASIRLLDNAHFRLGQALRGEQSISQAAAGFAMKLLSSAFQSMSVTSMVCATILFEGSEYEVREQRKKIKDLANKHGGISLGPEIGRSGYELTFVIAYIRDFALSFNYLGDSFETFCPWSKIEQMISSTKDAIKREHKLRYLPGEIFVGCRVTQLYHEGACVYFYMCMHCGNTGDASLAFAEIENVARQEILILGGSLSHHHGIGKLRSPFLREMGSNAYRDNLLALKKGLDPLNTFGAGNGVFGEKSSEI